ncbi:hypothetical protein A2763_03650 [Candidatus Kaiserbacteria bacterium RIFCSPHIGHO2_01_FULL_54_36]|uniref:Type 4 fimbrial biogenesis protein PilX N-terminal domain-containing protein n=1 Tax=Candidatus Kaiserbacteria bacterium RIFCSPHIGHO2_01_FULL_54_36 TaxID=1798482 RepID=A0A1F6CN95_9BACT|nr:MAG: hypothetical protein A2763_03650 [Candidatus Kaiserbacteria bacterium RIFCSPHIGHO2_01_FULL_54_36]OGG75958.1 MAG: hypothetical protein A3A41_01745 [Candidatus Kaiserbacteria bacterium RIFCSPLOWO2_01_FULL_54_22]
MLDSLSGVALKTKNSQLKTTQRGFTLLLAALVASIVLSVGAAIFSIAQKQLTLSAIGRDSQFAFYAADTAAECALYWDFRCNYFATSTNAINPSCNNPDPMCDGERMQASGRPSQAPYYPYTMSSAQMNFFTDIDPFVGFCAEVTVTKCQGTFTSSGVCTSGGANAPIRTIIHADGYSTSCTTILTSSRALQRSVELHY